MISRLPHPIVAIVLIGMTGSIYAQSLEPRAYSNSPAGMNFLLVGYSNAKGALSFDPVLPVTDDFTESDIGLLGYVHTLNFAGKSAKVGLLLPNGVH